MPLEELAKHNTADDLWTAVYGIVYDLTDYHQKHKGGSMVIVDIADRDGTTEFEPFHKEKDLEKVTQHNVSNLETL